MASRRDRTVCELTPALLPPAAVRELILLTDPGKILSGYDLPSDSAADAVAASAALTRAAAGVELVTSFRVYFVGELGWELNASRE